MTKPAFPPILKPRRTILSWIPRRIPVFYQMEAMDCGPACLAMVLGYYGKQVSLEEIRQITGTGRDGLSAGLLLEIGRRFGLEGCGIRLEAEEVKALPAGTVLYWESNHFVVFEKQSQRGIHLIDPSWGRRVLTMEQFTRSFTGICLLFEPGDAFEASGSPSPSVWGTMLKNRNVSGFNRENRGGFSPYSTVFVRTAFINRTLDI
ncbi:hypothetical protein LJK88_32025 [Paenibacillus sp. P26]|nr:hypothetical protein LJK88_32025 [Paenibacillus sp. P26]UUZ94176.1 hypothetical protein LJK87_06050 [Paenibacillus sp. P25]